MPRIAYESKRFGAASTAIIHQANTILHEYAEQGFDLTLRQLFYQFVARDLFANIQQNYKKLGTIVNDARLAGHIDWDHIVDRTRNLRRLNHWDDPADLVDWANRQFRVSLWEDQPVYVETWIEKDALVGVIQGICQELDIPYFSCRGYTSQSEMWGASQRLLKRLLDGQDVTILHLGDHDPSGIDMTRDITDRIWNFCAQDYLRDAMDKDELDGENTEAVKAWADGLYSRVNVRRIALNMNQIDQYEPPPNPARVTDSRYASYRVEYGDESWELDALDPPVIAALIRDNAEDIMDGEKFNASVEREQEGRRLLGEISKNWDEIVKHLDGE